MKIFSVFFVEKFCFMAIYSYNYHVFNYIKAGFNTPWSSNATTIRAEGINHSSMMKDNQTMKDIYDDIFEGKKGVDGYFKTPK